MSDDTTLEPLIIEESTPEIIEESLGALPGEEEIITRKPKQKKKRTDGDFLKSEAQIKKRDEMKKAMKSFLPILRQAKSRNANEADTANIVHKLFQDVLCWDFLDLTSEYKIKSTFCDLAIKFEGNILLLIEVKAIGLNLKEEHLRQAYQYAAAEGVKFALLTNGEVYQLYHVGYKDKIIVTQVFEFNLNEEMTLQDYTELYLISKFSLTKNQIEEYWLQEATLSVDNLCDAIMSEEIINAIAKYFRANYELKVSPATIKSKLETLL